MMELFDMGKYDFFVWGSIGVFVVALVLDLSTAKSSQKQVIKQIKAKIRRKQ
ncbi:heme exporter protein CcmD [Marinicella sp. S1101]|uniref:heme exporter protein CcmD n=1 Tax=Marinicella marina TaxID=2996016 RepID=UPI002260BADE|nr:heme exporter protein CcmD [Marinicella marina]MCX7554514.1 heme exporter protein CcmD [Marinicella marina]MDJ1140665.1 heme exporter protein CcmD [Marinicella marina]